MARTKTKVDEKKKLVVVENGNVFEDERREYKPLLDISVYSCYVEVPYEEDSIKPMKLELAAAAAVKAFEKELREGLRDLANKIEKLQADEKKGNKKAVAEAGKLVKSHDKTLKDSPGDYNIAIRKAVQKVVAAETGKKVQLRSVGRSQFKGLKLASSAFLEEDESDEVDLEELGDDLEKSSKKFMATAEDEQKARKAAAEAGAKLVTAADTAKKKATKFDYGQFTSAEKALVTAAEGALGAYRDLLTRCQAEATKSDKAVAKLASDKLIKADKEAAKALKEFRAHFDKVDRLISEQLKSVAASVKAAQALRDDAALKQLRSGADQLAKPSGLGKLLGEMDKVVEQLDKLAKKR